MSDVTFTFTLGQLSGFILGICGLIVSVSGAAAVIIKCINKAKAPEKTQNDRLTALEERVAKHDQLLTDEEVRISKMGRGQRVMQRALLALLEFMLDPSGNDCRASIESAKTNLMEYLME